MRFGVDIRSSRCPVVSSKVVLFFEVVEIVALCISTASHANVTSDADTAALFCHQLAQGRAFRKTRELLCAEDGERDGFDLESVRDVSALLHLGVLGRLGVQVLGFFKLLVQ